MKITKPIATPTVPILVCSPDCDSGISSSTTTYIIAPAAKESKYGKTGTTGSMSSFWTLFLRIFLFS